MQEPLDYRGLRRWLSLPALMILFPLSAAFIGGVLGIALAFGTMGFGALAIANTIIVFVVPIVGTIALGALGAVWGLARAKSKTISAFRAVRLDDDHLLARITADLAATIDLPVPEVYAYEADDINAWATGSSASNAAIGMSTGALERLSHDALAAIVAHELGHIASGDMVRMQMAISFQNATVFLAGWLGMSTPARNTFGLIGEIGVKWLSRRREYWADAVGAALTDAETMQAVLRSLEHERPSTSHRKRHQLLFHWNRGWLLSSHPSVGQRVRALERGAFQRSVMNRLGRSPSNRRMDTEGWVGSELDFGFRGITDRLHDQWNRLSDNTVAALVFALALPLSMLGWQELYFHGPRSTATTVAETTPDGPRVAGWSSEPAREQKSQKAPTPKSSAPDKVAALPVYPKEPRYEPDDAMGDGELTPYQLLVEEGVTCIYRAKLDDGFGSEYLEDAGPDKSDLIVYTLPASQQHADLSLSLVGTQATSCWKAHGGAQREPDIMKRMQQTYDIWILTDTQSGATAECGIWPVARKVQNGKGGIAAYCR